MLCYSGICFLFRMSKFSFKRVTFSPFFFYFIRNARFFGNRTTCFLPNLRYVFSALQYVVQSMFSTDRCAAVRYFFQLYAVGKQLT